MRFYERSPKNTQQEAVDEQKTYLDYQPAEPPSQWDYNPPAWDSRHPLDGKDGQHDWSHGPWRADEESNIQFQDGNQ